MRLGDSIDSEILAEFNEVNIDLSLSLNLHTLALLDNLLVSVPDFIAAVLLAQRGGLLVRLVEEESLEQSVGHNWGPLSGQQGHVWTLVFYFNLVLWRKGDSSHYALRHIGYGFDLYG